MNEWMLIIFILLLFFLQERMLYSSSDSMLNHKETDFTNTTLNLFTYHASYILLSWELSPCAIMDYFRVNRCEGPVIWRVCNEPHIALQKICKTLKCVWLDSSLPSEPES